MTDADAERPEWVDRAGQRLGASLQHNAGNWLVFMLIVGMLVYATLTLRDAMTVPYPHGPAPDPGPIERVVVVLGYVVVIELLMIWMEFWQTPEVDDA